MTIAIISMIRDPWGGSEELWYQAAKLALQEGHTVIHLSYEHPVQHPRTQELIQAGLIELTRPGWIPRSAGPLQQFLQTGWNFTRKKIRNPFNKLMKHRPDLILYNGTCYSIAREAQLNRLLLEKERSLPFFLIGHLNHDLIRDITDQEASTIRSMYKRSRKVFFVSSRNLQTARRHLCTDISNAAIIRNPVNLKETGCLPYPGKANAIHLALVGNLVTIHKGQDLLFQVLHQENWIGEPWVLNIYGSGIDEDYLKNLALHFGLQDKIRFHGTVQDIRKVWEVNHALIMPSHMEGMPLAVVEAMLSGRICIATDVGGHREWIDDGLNGFLAEGSNTVALDKAMSRAWAKRDVWEEMGKAAFLKASSLYEKEPGRKLLEYLMER